MVLIAPSLLSADFLHLADDIKAIEKAGADLLHIDVMDGHFVPNLTMGPVLIKAIKKVATVPLDVHLMIDEPERSVADYIESGADRITLHVESCVHLERALKEIHRLGAKAGVALNPSTHESSLGYVLSELDHVLVMSVNPGFSGQYFLPEAVKKITAIKGMLKQQNNNQCLIFVDGGINAQTGKDCVDAGADCLIAGSYIFGSDYKSAIASLR